MAHAGSLGHPPRAAGPGILRECALRGKAQDGRCRRRDEKSPARHYGMLKHGRDVEGETFYAAPESTSAID